MMSDVFAWESREQGQNNVLPRCCPRCDNDLALHQPDAEMADRLLATCENCKSWFLTNSDLSVLVPLPELVDDAV